MLLDVWSVIVWKVLRLFSQLAKAWVCFMDGLPMGVEKTNMWPCLFLQHHTYHITAMETVRSLCKA